jgi:hypothetical protein
MKRGHSNIHAEGTKPYSDDLQDVAKIPLWGGTHVYIVKELPPLALRREEWKTVGEIMGWMKDART